jgi:hypothetical protein
LINNACPYLLDSISSKKGEKMKKLFLVSFLLVPFVLIISFFAGSSFAADVVPNEIMMPGTQPNEVQNFESPDKCDNCHGGYDEARAYSNEPAFGWRGGAMGNAGRDPIFWATLAIAEQDFDGAGDLCIRCHSAGGWIAGRSTPTDGSGLAANDDDGIDCDTCHKATNPDNSEHQGVMNPGFEAYDPVTGEGYYGSGILSVWGSSDKLGPFNDANARHQWMQSRFHRGDICGSCHDVSNPAVGDLAPGNGAQPTADPVISSGGNLGGPIGEKAAFNNPPYMYGIVERTFSEWKSGALDTMDVRNFPNLPAELQVQSGALNMAYQSAMLAGGTYEDGTIRTFSCQSCHMRPDIGEGCNKAGVLTRSDLPKHDQSGGNYWIWPLIQYQDQQGTLRLGGGLTALQIAAMDAGQIRAQDQLTMAATLTVDEFNDTVTITNLTGHKLISGYPEGRRMWLNIKWYDGTGTLVREDGAYGRIGAQVQNPSTGQLVDVESLVDLHDPNTEVFEAHYAMTQEWAATLMAVNAAYYGPIVLSYDRVTGDPGPTISDLAAQAPGSYHETFHFVLNNYVANDNRIPPYGMDYETARTRNALPVPASQYGGGTAQYNGLTNVYEYWRSVQLHPPANATGADITLYYQGTSWEYIQFLAKANNGQNAFLGDEGVNMLDAWLNADPAAPMVPPVIMATATWGTACNPTGIPEDVCNGTDDDCDGLVDEDFVTTQSTCGTGVCASTGLITCVNGVVSDDCSEGSPTESTEVTCDDSLDNDCDGATDGSDPDCGGMTCSDYVDKGSCNNDPNCEWTGSPKNGSCQDLVPCSPTSPDEAGLCNDGVDNDCDGVTDCADTADCGNDPVCQVDCSVYTTRNLCNNQPSCTWDNQNKVCINL